MVMEVLQYLSIVLELIVFLLGVAMVAKKKTLGWFFIVTFGVYVFYDFVKLTGMAVNLDILYISFFIATLSALILAWRVYKKK